MLIRETPMMIDGPSGQLEALCLEVAEARGVALICHPNPVQGGTMLNKVVSVSYTHLTLPTKRIV